MQVNHVTVSAPEHFQTVVQMLKTKLGFVELRRAERAIWLRQPGANVDLPFSRSPTANRDEDKLRSQISFLSETPRSDLEDLAAAWARRHGVRAEVGSYSDRTDALFVTGVAVDRQKAAFQAATNRCGFF